MNQLISDHISLIINWQ